MFMNQPKFGFFQSGIVVFGLAFVGCGPSYPNCDRDEQCRDGEHCVDNTCQQCGDDSHCSRGQRCNAGACEDIPGWCDGATDCGPGEECVENRCQALAAAETQGPQEDPRCQLEAVYYGFDDSTLDETARGALGRDATCIQERSIGAVQVTGMTDPRGTEEYNMALGDRRARSARDHLQRLGVSSGTLTIRSVGEEMATGSDESSWGRDRRADLQER